MPEAEFGKGTRVRIVEGDNTDVVGVIFWWGRSKWGDTMRAGVTADGGEKHWAAATELRAIDEEGNELDPQPVVKTPPPPTAPTVRHCDFPYPLARLLTAARLKRRWPRSKANEAVVRLEVLRRAEEHLGCRIPDAVLAYVASGLGCVNVATGLARLTADLHDTFDQEVPTSVAKFIVFDNDNGDYLAFSTGAAADDSTFELLLHEEAFLQSAASDLQTKLEAEVGDVENLDSAIQAFRVMWDFRRDPEPADEPAEIWVKHKKFGRGIVLASNATSKGDKLTIRFEDGEERKLLSAFVEFS